MVGIGAEEAQEAAKILLGLLAGYARLPGGPGGAEGDQVVFLNLMSINFRARGHKRLEASQLKLQLGDDFWGNILALLGQKMSLDGRLDIDAVRRAHRSWGLGAGIEFEFLGAPGVLGSGPSARLGGLPVNLAVL